MTQKSEPANDEPGETIVEHLIRSIRDAIREGQFVQGQRLVVMDVCKEFGVSAGPVREAIRRLAGEGMLEFVPHRGAVVKVITERDVRETFQVREAVEGYAARLAAENIHRGDYAKRLRACRDQLHATIDNLPEQTRIRQLFHDLLYEFAGNDVLRETATRLTSALYRNQFNKAVGAERFHQSLREHDEIIEAVLSGSAALAERCMRQHLRNGAEAVCEVVQTASAVPDKKKKRG
ncbi:MAG: GntR family transcriptional regulator [Hyphomonadaceae bacterium]|nr:GntR family transcriptional regulator [Hyphomonadaceae bacterium]